MIGQEAAIYTSLFCCTTGTNNSNYNQHYCALMSGPEAIRLLIKYLSVAHFIAPDIVAMNVCQLLAIKLQTL